MGKEINNLKDFNDLLFLIDNQEMTIRELRRKIFQSDLDQTEKLTKLSLGNRLMHIANL